jgi:hypothetical protein
VKIFMYPFKLFSRLEPDIRAKLNEYEIEAEDESREAAVQAELIDKKSKEQKETQQVSVEEEEEAQQDPEKEQARHRKRTEEETVVEEEDETKQTGDDHPEKDEDRTARSSDHVHVCAICGLKSDTESDRSASQNSI